MYLSEIEGIEIKKDGYFENFGKLGRIYLENSISFIHSEKYLPDIDQNISCIVCNEELLPFFLGKDIGIVVSKEPKNTFYEIYYTIYSEGRLNYFDNKISDSATISPKATIASSGVIIGDNCVIADNVVIREGTILENNVHIGNNCVLGSDGYEVAKIYGHSKIVPHTGYCILKDNVEILNNCCVCKGLFRGYDTIIEENVKIDNIVQIAHAVKIGKNTEIGAGAVISGNTIIGENVWIGPNVTLSNKIKVGNNAFVSLGAVLINDINDGERVAGNFAYDTKKFMNEFKMKKSKE
ncbi:UDP-3-O-(3-hydroxymyristoyl)glucosamine N-acyltransferase [Petrotoga sp. 9PWA.NaAc.5.4]|uniref:UDP-3-O-(3-hydroxymyristoyl)glucosamine N-acyltransferase n=1 Tax=Petrotoga sp. 9PWA.NaAc.5.4 TaxID=1434328 RepID=UPI000CC02FB7|nr:UDP-3-O-(3-hydroxymyristoyl)glucosamine N-acyltransferase [Petrotoga sp. 9PWA.NaAc.5.4]PNR94749.1 hypothetical protein X924_05655 [Petrotoga sp. 9PWA.NaAc.5.4]